MSHSQRPKLEFDSQNCVRLVFEVDKRALRIKVEVGHSVFKRVMSLIFFWLAKELVQIAERLPHCCLMTSTKSI